MPEDSSPTTQLPSEGAVSLPADADAHLLRALADPPVSAIRQFIPESGQVYVSLGLSEYQKVALAQRATQQATEQQSRIVALSSALLSLGVDPITLQKAESGSNGNGEDPGGDEHAG